MNGSVESKAINSALEKVELAKLDNNSHNIARNQYQQQLKALQNELQHIQQAYAQQNLRAIIAIEGTDASGKGGLIKRLVQDMDPRLVHVWPIGAPRYEEREHHYLYRFWKRVPKNGEIVIFDRTWYGRVLVERIDKLTPREHWMRAYGEIKEFERQLSNDGIRMVKLFLHISKKEQESRFIDRLQQPTKRWKLTIDDFNNRAKWDAYQEAYQDMINLTSTEDLPWFVVPAEHKRYARIHALAIIRDILGAGVDVSQVNRISPKLRKAAQEALGVDVLPDEA